MKQSKQKKPWSSTELLMAAALVLCLVAAGFMIMFFSNGLMEYNEAEEDYDALEEAYVHEAEVEEVKISIQRRTTPGYQFDAKTGFITWKLTMKPNELKRVTLEHKTAKKNM